MTTPAFAITLFGPMQVRLHGQPLPRLRSRKALWLLALLALRHGRPVEREWLAGILWPDVGQTQSFASLRAVLSELRTALGSEGERLRSPSRYTLALDLTDAYVDVLAFDAAVIRGEPAELRSAVALYDGMLLEGCAEEWVAQDRMAREQDCLDALRKLADVALAAGDSDTAIPLWRRAVSLAPRWEVAHRGLMEALARSGDNNAALQVYRELVAAIRRDDPRATPDEETTALYQRLRTQARRRATDSAVPAEVDGAAGAGTTGILPYFLTELVGREDERLEVATGLQRSRLVTLTGPGGIGKTRLAVAVAGEVRRQYPDGVWLAPLEALADPDLVPEAVARVLGVAEETRRSLAQTLAAALKGKRLLLVLDNCEHLLAASARLADYLLRECAGVRVLATSREPLGVAGEMVWAVPPLAVPDPDHLPEGATTRVRVLAGYEGVQLFVERVQAAQKMFTLTGENAAAVARICFRLEGVPLALELAAARIRAMRVEQVAARLEDRLSGSLALLTGGSRTALSRQQTLRATLDWSYDLLSEPERILLRRLSVFCAGCPLSAAEQVCAGGEIASEAVLDLLTSLVDKSLVVFEERYRLLDMVRQYAAEKLEASGEKDAVRDRHLAWFLALVEEAAVAMNGAGQTTWLRRLDAECDNLRAALVRSGEQEHGAEAGLRLAGALWWFWKLRGRFGEGRQYIDAALGRPGAQEETGARARALNAAGALALNQGEYVAARTYHEESLRLFQALGDGPGIGAALNHLGNLADSQGDPVAARTYYEESLRLCREHGDTPGVAKALNSLGSMTRLQGDYGSARAIYAESLELYRKMDDTQGVAMTLANQGNMARLQGEYGEARALLEESLAICREMGNRQGAAMALSHLGSAVIALGDFAAARALYEESLSIRRELGETRRIAWSLTNLGLTALYEERPLPARAWFEEGRAIFEKLGDRGGVAWSLNHLGDVAFLSGDLASARALYEESLRRFRDLADREGIVENLRDLAALRAAQSEGPVAALLWGAAEALGKQVGVLVLPIEKARYERRVGQARAATDAAAFTAAWAEGSALTWEQATARAVAEG